MAYLKLLVCLHQLLEIPTQSKKHQNQPYTAHCLSHGAIYHLLIIHSNYPLLYTINQMQHTAMYLKNYWTHHYQSWTHTHCCSPRNALPTISQQLELPHLVHRRMHWSAPISVFWRTGSTSRWITWWWWWWKLHVVHLLFALVSIVTLLFEAITCKVASFTTVVALVFPGCTSDGWSRSWRSLLVHSVQVHRLWSSVLLRWLATLQPILCKLVNCISSFSSQNCVFHSYKVWMPQNFTFKIIS